MTETNKIQLFISRFQVRASGSKKDATVVDGVFAGWQVISARIKKVKQKNKKNKKKTKKDKRKEQRNNYILIWGGSSYVSIFFTSAFALSALRPCEGRICRCYEGYGLLLTLY